MEQVIRIRFDYADAIPWMRQVRARRARRARRCSPSPARTRSSCAARSSRPTTTRTAPSSTSPRARPSTSCSPGSRRTGRRRQPLDVDERIKQHPCAGGRAGRAAACIAGRYDDEVRRSLLVLRALTHEDTGGIVAAATTSLPEEFGGARNWDYRYVWLRDAALTLEALLEHGFDSRGRGVARLAAARDRRRSRPTCRSCTGWRASAAWPSRS